MSAPLLECVPNFSEGRDLGVVDELAAAVAAVAGVSLLDHSADRDHNRCVLTFAGPADAVEQAAYRAAELAARRIDLSAHRGVHPRMGAIDACPFVPLSGADIPRAVAAARAVGRRIGEGLGVPVYLYGRAATSPERAALGFVRNRGFERLRELVGRDPELEPDFGPARVHPTAGATAVGARPFLIAFNVDLATRDVAIARRIARAVRESSGGLPAVQALGLELEERGCAQVSTNVLDFEATPLRALFDRIVELAREDAVDVAKSELIGLAPAAALDARIAEHLRLDGFDPSRQVVERALSARRAGPPSGAPPRP